MVVGMFAKTMVILMLLIVVAVGASGDGWSLVIFEFADYTIPFKVGVGDVIPPGI